MNILYDFYCSTCNKTYEDYCDSSQIDKATCPQCKGTVERVFSPIKAVIWNCDGAHKTDYVKDGPKDRTPKSYYENKKKMQELGMLEDPLMYEQK